MNPEPTDRPSIPTPPGAPRSVDHLTAPPGLHVTAPPSVAPGRTFSVEVRVLNASAIVDRLTVEVATSPATVVDDPRRDMTLFPQQDWTSTFEITAPEADAIRADGAPWRLAVRVRARAEAAGTEAVGLAHVQVLVAPSVTKPGPRPGATRRQDEFHLLADHPVEREGDLLGADETASRIAGMILDIEAATPFTLGVQGGWGAGKSSLMQLIRRHVEARAGGRRVRVAWFNAWTANGSDALPALIRAVLRELDRNVLRRIVRRTRATSWLKLPFAVLGSWLGSHSLADEVWRLFALDAPRRNEIRTEIQRALGDWADRDRALRAGRLLVVFVDDLDRCAPENVARVLEAIRVYLDAPGLVFVIGYDPDVVADALRGETTSGHRYLEKIVQVDHAMPRPDPGQARELARLCARHCGVEQLLGDAELALIAERGQRNPRRIKRFLNTFVLARRLEPSADRLWPDEHIKLLLLRLHFPSFFQLMTTEPEQDVVRLLLELSRLRSAVLARREPNAEQVAWLCETSGLAEREPGPLLDNLERHLPPLIVGLSRDRDLFTLLWSLGDDTQRADLLHRLGDPTALRTAEPTAEKPAPRVPPTPQDLATPPETTGCDHAAADRTDDFCPWCGEFLRWDSAIS